jgi:hypothetical protein
MDSTKGYYIHGIPVAHESVSARMASRSPDESLRAVGVMIEYCRFRHDLS